MKKSSLMLASFAVVALFAASCSSGQSSGSEGTDAQSAVEESSANSNDISGSATFDIDKALAADANCDDPVTSEDPLVIGYAADLSELGGFADGPASAAAEHFINQVNCSGGVGGRQLLYVGRDISGDPEATALAGQELLDEGAVAILGPPFAEFGAPLLQVTEGNVPVLFTASTEPSLSDPAALSYLVAFDDTRQARAAAQFALDQGWVTASTFSAPGPYFGYNPEIFTEEFEAGGGTVLDDYNFTPIDDVDFSSQVNEIAAGDSPDVIYSAMLSFQLTALKGQLEGADVDTELLSTDVFEATGGYAGDNIEGIFHTTHAFPTEHDGRVVTLDESFEAATGEKSESPTFAALAVDGVVVIIDAYLRSGSDSPEELGAAIADGENIVGATGLLSYNGSGTPTKPVYIHQVVDGEPSLAEIVEN